jgi:hypothetical protein
MPDPSPMRLAMVPARRSDQPMAHSRPRWVLIALSLGAGPERHHDGRRVDQGCRQPTCRPLTRGSEIWRMRLP